MAPTRKQNPDDAAPGRAKPKAPPKKAASRKTASKKATEGAAKDSGPKPRKKATRAPAEKAPAEKSKASRAEEGQAPEARTSETKASARKTPTASPMSAPAAWTAPAARTPQPAAPAAPAAATAVPSAPPRPAVPAWGAPAAATGTRGPVSPAPPTAPASAGRVIPPLPDDEHDPEPFDEGPNAPQGRVHAGLLQRGGQPAGAEDGDFEDDDDGDDGDDGEDGEDAAPPQGALDEAARMLEAVRRGERHISTLDALGDAQVVGLAQAQGWQPRLGERRSETIFRLLQGRPAQPEPPESVLVEGLLELHPDGYGFLRRPQQNYVQHPLDVYVPAGLVRRLGLKAGHWVSGQAHRARPHEPTLALHEVQEVNHEDPARLASVVPFEKLTVVYPDTRYVLEVNPGDIEMRLMDLFCPLGRGQRGLIVAPPRSGKTVILQKLADAIAHNSPNADIVVLLVDERPEEVTNMRRSVRGEVIASTFDKPVANHVRVAELTIEKVKRMVELGRHVVLLLDSITRLGRAYNNLAPTSGRILSGGMDAGALTKPKLFFASARNVEDGGSLTILATALVDTGSRLDTLVFEEFKGSGNMEVVLDRDLANQRIWPAINIPASGTRNEDLLLHPEELRRITRLRRALSDHAPADAMVLLKDMMKQHTTNAELVMSIE